MGYPAPGEEAGADPFFQESQVNNPALSLQKTQRQGRGTRNERSSWHGQKDLLLTIRFAFSGVGWDSCILV